MVQLVSKDSDVMENVTQLSRYIAERTGSNAEFARKLIKNGVCFVVVDIDGLAFFAPSRFVGYVNNSRQSHLSNYEKDGRVTNAALMQILGSNPVPSPGLEQEFSVFCARLGIIPKATGNFGVMRKFWDIRTN